MPRTLSIFDRSQILASSSLPSQIHRRVIRPTDAALVTKERSLICRKDVL